MFSLLLDMVKNQVTKALMTVSIETKRKAFRQILPSSRATHRVLMRPKMLPPVHLRPWGATTRVPVAAVKVQKLSWQTELTPSHHGRQFIAPQRATTSPDRWHSHRCGRGGYSKAGSQRPHCVVARRGYPRFQGCSPKTDFVRLRSKFAKPTLAAACRHAPFSSIPATPTPAPAHKGPSVP